MALITGIKRFITWYVLTAFRTVFLKKKGGVQIHLFGYIVDFDKHKNLIVAKRDGKDVRGAFSGHKTIYKGYRIP